MRQLRGPLFEIPGTSLNLQVTTAIFGAKRVRNARGGPPLNIYSMPALVPTPGPVATICLTDIGKKGICLALN